MANWKQAWRVLLGGLPAVEPTPEPERPEPEIQYIVGEPVTVYAAIKRERADPEFNYFSGQFTIGDFERVISYHLTCAEAFAAGGVKAETKTAYRSGDEYFLISRGERIEIAPKPKTAKGRR